MAFGSTMQCYNTKNFMFSFSAAVYGDTKYISIKASFSLPATNPFGQTKLISERILHNLEHTDANVNIGYSHYHKPVGAHNSKLIGEARLGVPINLMSFVVQAAVGKLDKLRAYWGNHVTADTTSMRDFINVIDLAQGYVTAPSHLSTARASFIGNFGTCRGHSGLEVKRTSEITSLRQIPFEFVGGRLGGIAACYSDASLSCMDAWLVSDSRN